METLALATRQDGELEALGQAANERAAASVFADYRSRKAANTLRRQDAELKNFGRYVGRDRLHSDTEQWRGVTWGVVDAFCKQMLLDGYAVATVNFHLSTIKTYTRLAAKAGVIPSGELALICSVQGYGHQEGQRIDEKREVAGIATRKSTKKAGFHVLSEAQATMIRAACDTATAQGRRDAALLVLLLDLGLRVSEAAGLRADDFDPATGVLTVYRKKTDTTTRFTLQNGKLATLRAYFENDKPTGQLLQGSRKSGVLEGSMSKRAIAARVRAFGALVGIADLSPHDLRHTAATRNAAKMNARELQDFFGWNSPAMASRYIEACASITVD